MLLRLSVYGFLKADPEEREDRFGKYYLFYVRDRTGLKVNVTVRDSEACKATAACVNGDCVYAEGFLVSPDPKYAKSILCVASFVTKVGSGAEKKETKKQHSDFEVPTEKDDLEIKAIDKEAIVELKGKVVGEAEEFEEVEAAAVGSRGGKKRKATECK